MTLLRDVARDWWARTDRRVSRPWGWNRVPFGHAHAAGEVIADGEAEGGAAELLRGGHVDGFGGGIGVDLLRVGGGGAHPVALGALGGGGDIAGEVGHAGDDEADLAVGMAVGFIHAVAEAAVEGIDEAGEGFVQRSGELDGERGEAAVEG